MMRLAGSPVDPIADKFGLGRDAVYRHMAKHVDAETRAMLIADVPLREMADKAAKESVSLLEHYQILRSTLMTKYLALVSMDVRSASSASTLAGRLRDVLKDMGELTGEMLRTPSSTVTNNIAVFVNSPAFVQLQEMMIRKLSPHPEALRAVLEGLRELESEAPPPIDPRPLLTLTANEGRQHAA